MRIRFFGCGEYGESSGRPHYHALLFNCGFDDVRQVGKNLTESETVNRLWPMGKHVLGKVTHASAMYIAQYSLKKQGPGDVLVVDRETGEIRPDPFLRMSLKPGIGAVHLERHGEDYRKGYFTVNGQRHAVPRAYRERLKRSTHLQHVQLAEEISYNSFSNSQSYRSGDLSDPERLRAGEVIHKKRKELSERRVL